ncbi:hypothetical protein ACEWY4_004129 [Coilia grayii]|uniref:Uncharacterized protein n=1 Tax=Coilia grayii TaxID=363190 RepID=A0ABD1KKN9_9TELE
MLSSTMSSSSPLLLLLLSSSFCSSPCGPHPQVNPSPLDSFGGHLWARAAWSGSSGGRHPSQTEPAALLLPAGALLLGVPWHLWEVIRATGLIDHRNQHSCESVWLALSSVRVIYLRHRGQSLQPEVSCREPALITAALLCYLSSAWPFGRACESLGRRGLPAWFPVQRRALLKNLWEPSVGISRGRRGVFRLGAVELQPVPEPVAVVRELIAHGLERAAQLHSRNQQLQEENQRFRQEQQRINADMERYVSGKETLERELYSRFVLVLNEKKKKIRALQARVKELEVSLEEERRQRKHAGAGAGEAAERGSPLQSSPRRETDYGGSTDEEEEKEEQPSTSGIQTSAKDVFSSGPMDDDPSDITDVAPNRKRRQRHLQQLEAQAKRLALDQRPHGSSRSEQTHPKAEAKAEAAHCPPPVAKVNPEPEDLFDDF